jgi:septal ring factor EnvC (AmiA/AmiB activator)
MKKLTVVLTVLLLITVAAACWLDNAMAKRQQKIYSLTQQLSVTESLASSNSAEFGRQIAALTSTNAALSKQIADLQAQLDAANTQIKRLAP